MEPMAAKPEDADDLQLAELLHAETGQVWLVPR